ncbi:MAG: ribose-phosphate pyrophosphokinase [Chloroflexi bacterium]|nr:MAG: ribose-phosphate pyrophosphokinase [Actinobacteria bacterium 13_2_20CM_2_66_6]TMC08250.1 MAG: ribose-phosphate pyrophosphokinase [Chloroflexota bacterium]TMD79697.1 MAG: ribose-phosphate pyrophosphokinase [Chloroflexota bacterium]TMF04320.1 MAG: ribose-phosphate pyrophosphokinase [Chloroflexota bacterium]TMG28649.1 MAG: ribose-phosphate pyrophosphokinase [Chloroflexota bacterium]
MQTAVEYVAESASPWGELKLLGGSANPALSEKISAQLRVPLTDTRLRRFADGEINVKIEDSMRGHDVFVIQPTCPPVNEHLMELFIILDALRRASAGRVTAVIPYYGYARKERKTQPREPISAKLVANFITLAGADRLLLLDLHAEAIEGFFDVPTDHLSPFRIFADHLRTLNLHNLTVVAPDAGGGRRAEAVANQLQAPIAFGYKRRPEEDQAEVIAVSGDVKGRDCVVVEDIITTGGTISKLAQSLRLQGAHKVLIAATHPVLTGDAVDRLKKAQIDDVIVTDSVPIAPERLGPPITVLSVAPLLAEAIIRVHENRSVSELFR